MVLEPCPQPCCLTLLVLSKSCATPQTRHQTLKMNTLLPSVSTAAHLQPIAALRWPIRQCGLAAGQTTIFLSARLACPPPDWILCNLLTTHPCAFLFLTCIVSTSGALRYLNITGRRLGEMKGMRCADQRHVTLLRGVTLPWLRTRGQSLELPVPDSQTLTHSTYLGFLFMCKLTGHFHSRPHSLAHFLNQATCLLSVIVLSFVVARCAVRPIYSILVAEKEPCFFLSSLYTLCQSSSCINLFETAIPSHSTLSYSFSCFCSPLYTINIILTKQVPGC